MNLDHQGPSHDKVKGGRHSYMRMTTAIYGGAVTRPVPRVVGQQLRLGTSVL